MKKHSLEIIVGILVTIGVALVLATGYLSYKSISAIVASIHDDTHPDEKLSLISEVATGLDKAENSIRLYAYTKNNSDLIPYKNLIENIDGQLDDLRESAAENERFLNNIDTVSSLIEEKIEVWNDMLALSNSNIANQFLDTISEQIESKIESDSVRKNRSIFKKLFKREKKQEIDEQKIVRNLEQFREEEKQHAQKIRQKEVQLATTNSQLTARLYNLINKLKLDENSERMVKAQEADQLALKTYEWIGWFSISATLSALIVIFVISTYVRKTRASRIALEASKAEAENLAKTKELFVANVSHEIRTPLNVISGFVDQMLKKPLEENLASTLKIVKSSSDHLVRIINDVLDFSKLQSGKMKLESVHYRIADLLDEIKMLFENQAAEKNSEFLIISDDKMPAVFYGDPIRLKQILINLLSNAIKFTKEGKVTLEMEAVAKEESAFQLKIVVADTGIGIDKNNLQKIFEDFTQAESGTSRKFGGTGLGLSIVKKLVEIHEGSIEVDSTKNRGTRFTCILPYKIGQQNLVEERISGEIVIPDEIKQLNGLIVDDEIYNRKLMRTILDKWKVKSEEAEDGDQAIEKIKNQKFNFILMDVQMPGADGFEVTDFIRNKLKKSSAETIIILTTATAVSKEEASAYQNLGIDAYLPKPFSEELLLKTLTDLFAINATPKKEYPAGQIKDHKAVDEGVIDLNELYRFAGNDHNFVKEMLERFIESFENGLEKMKSALSEGNIEMISNTAHKMASPCRHIGAGKLLENIKKTEHLAESKTSRGKIQEAMEMAEDEYAIVRDHILKHIEKLKN